MPYLNLTKKTLISAFIALNISTVLFINRPVWMSRGTDNFVTHHLSPNLAYRYHMMDWRLRSYAHVTGLDSTWQMFGRQSRFNWWYRIKGVYQGGLSIELPLPLQSPRTFWQNTFFDFKEGKYYLNLYPGKKLREAYAHYLCRQYPSLEGVPLQSIVFEIYHQMLLAPEQARRQGIHTAPQINSKVSDEFQCPPSAP